MARSTKPDHVTALQEPVKKGPAPDPNSGNQKMMRRRAEIDVKREKQGLPKKQRVSRIPKAKRDRIASAGAKHRKTMTDDKWKKFLELTANGVKRPDVIKILGVTKETFQSYMITSISASKQLREANAIWLRRSWPLEEIEEMLSKMSLGQTVKAAAIELGYDDEKLGRFYSLMRNDTRMRELYDIARELQAESWMDDNIDIADNRGEDTFIDQKGMRKTDHGVIQRDRLRVDVRQWTMSALNRKRFGEHKHIDHGGDITINHAALLSNARKRLENVKKPPVVIDNATQQVVNQ